MPAASLSSSPSCVPASDSSSRPCPKAQDPGPSLTPPRRRTAHEKQHRPSHVAETTRLLLDYLNPSNTLAFVALRHDVDLFDLIEWVERPEIVAAISRLRAADAHRARLLNEETEAIAVQALLRTVDSENPETIRRAAAALLRYCKTTAQARTGESPPASSPGGMVESARPCSDATPDGPASSVPSDPSVPSALPAPFTTAPGHGQEALAMPPITPALSSNPAQSSRTAPPPPVSPTHSGHGSTG